MYVELLYKSVHRKFNQLEIRCGRENQHPERPPAPRLSSPGERERNAVVAIGVGVNILQFCSVSNYLSHTTLSIKWEVYFSKELCRSSLLCRCYDSACICIWVCIVVHGYTTQEDILTWPFGSAVWHSCRMGCRTMADSRPKGPQLRLGHLRAATFVPFV